MLANIRPRNLSGRVDDKHCRGSNAIPEQIEHAISVGHSMIGVGQDRVIGLDELIHHLGACDILDGERQDLGFARAELRVR